MLRNFFASCLDYLFPQRCLCCHELLSDAFKTLCSTCQEDLILLPHLNRCSACFQQKEAAICPTCEKEARFCDYKAASFALTPAVAILLQNLKGNSPFLAPGIAAYLYLQWIELGWPKPDYICYVPNYFSFGNPYAAVALELGKLLQTPILKLLKKKECSLKQTHLSLIDRKNLSLRTFQLQCKMPSIEGKNILLLDDFIVTGSTMEACAYALLEMSPKRIYGLAFALEEFL